MMAQVWASLAVIGRVIVIVTLWAGVFDALVTQPDYRALDSYRWRVVLGVGCALALAWLLKG